MSELAVISLLWPKHHGLLKDFLAGRACVVYTMAGYNTEELRTLAAAGGGRVVVLESLLAPEAVAALAANAEQRADAVLSEFQAAAAVPEPWGPLLVPEDLGTRLTVSMEYIDMCEAALATQPIALMLVSEEYLQIARVLVAWAGRRDIPVVHVCHGTNRPRMHTAELTALADAYALMGDRAGDSLADMGVSEERLIPIGDAHAEAFQHAAELRPLARKLLCEHHGLDAGTPIVVLATTWAAYLTAFSDKNVYDDSILDFLRACQALRAAGGKLHCVIKDRVPNQSFAAERIAGIAAGLGMSSDDYLVTFSHPREWVLAADALVAMESTMLIEAMLAGTVPVNLWHDGIHVLGPAYGARDGVVAAFADDLAPVLARVLGGEAYRAQVLEQGRLARPGFMVASRQGESAQRLNLLLDTFAKSAERAGACSLRAAVPGGDYVWKELSNPADADLKGQYHDHPRKELLALMERPPRRVLDVGCATGATGLLIKTAWPDAHVTGIELHRAAAALAAGRIDKVISEPLERIDFIAEGLLPGTIDTVVLADVLEHLYDPWDALQRLRPLLTEDAQVLVSLPNMRNLLLVNELAKGNFRSEREGLLDVTHVRWFTRAEMVRMLNETGYRVLRSARTPTKGLENLTRPAGSTTVETDKIVLKDVSDEEFEDLKALQIMFHARPLAPGERIEEGGLPDLYKVWQMGHAYKKRDMLWMAERMQEIGEGPSFHLAVIALGADALLLVNNLKTLGHQFWKPWRLSIISDGPAPDAFEGSANLAWILFGAGTPLAAANRALSDHEADWVGLWEAGDKLTPHAFFAFADILARRPEYRAVYSDEDQVDAQHQHSTPFFKTDFNLEMLRAAPYAVGGLLLLRRDLFRELHGFDAELEGAEYFDLALRAWEQVGHAGFGHVPDILYHRYVSATPREHSATDATAMQRNALAAHLARCSVVAQLEDGLLPMSLHVRYALSGNPLVSILIPTKNQLELLKRCLTSLIDNTGYSNCEILVLDNGSDEREAVTYLKELRALDSPELRVIDCAGPFNFSAINNRGAREARGDYLVLLNNDTAVLHEEWLEEMLGLAQQTGVGAVGAKLFYPDGKVQHAGVILGINESPADHPFIGELPEAAGYFGRLQLPQELSAVSAACLLVKRSLYLEAGGLDETKFQVSYNDVDFCLRLARLGYRNVFTPHARLLHEGSKSQTGAVESRAKKEKEARFVEEQNRFYAAWRHEVAFDPAYNRNLSFTDRDFLIEIAPALSWAPEHRPRPRILAHPADRWGCGEYRIISPMRALNEDGRIMGWETGRYLAVPELFRLEPDVILLQRQVDAYQLDLVERYVRHSKALRIYEIDDLITNIPVRSSRKKHFVEQKDLHKRFRKGLALCQRFIVSTEYLAEHYRGYNDDIRVVPNYIERLRWGELKPKRNASGKARVGWAGSITHDGDLAEIFDVVKATAKEVNWVFLGMCPDEIRPLVAEFHVGVPLEQYPAKLASLDLDLAVAPLEDVPFNHGKSHLRLLEYGVLGYPVICTDITPYRGDFPVTRVPNRFKDWVEAIRSHVADRDALARRGDVLRDYINANWILEDHLDVWQKAWLP